MYIYRDRGSAKVVTTVPANIDSTLHLHVPTTMLCTSLLMIWQSAQNGLLPIGLIVDAFTHLHDTHMHTHTHACMYLRVHTHTHTHTQDVEDLAKECEDELQESKASARLGRKVDAMIGRLDQALQELEDDLVSTSPESPTVQMIQKEK